jgi:hypothetical protein
MFAVGIRPFEAKLFQAPNQAPAARPPFMPRFSMAAELENYAHRVAFAQVETHHGPPLVILTARKMRMCKKSGAMPVWPDQSEEMIEPTTCQKLGLDSRTTGS